MITKSDAGDINSKIVDHVLKNINPNATLVESIYQPVCFYDIAQSGGLKKERSTIPLSGIDDKHICLLCSIANPQYFEKIIMDIGLNPALKFYFMDHYEYQKQDLEDLFNTCRKNKIRTIITTEKDAVKLKELIGDSGSDFLIFVLRIEFKIIKNEEGFFDRVLSIYRR